MKPYSELESIGVTAPGPRAIQSDVAILAVVVLYRTSPQTSRTLRTLKESALNIPNRSTCFKVLIYDNTPGGHNPGALPDLWEYHASGVNHGLASAYNFALQVAVAQGFSWLLTLDQDTEISSHYLTRLFELAQRFQGDDRTAAIAPSVVDRERTISPHLQFCGFQVRLPRNFQGFSVGEIAVINSGTAWLVSALREIGGFHPLFWLDYLDYWLCHSIYHMRKRIYIDNRLRLHHELSLLDLKDRMSLGRFENFLSAETAFYDLYRSPFEGAVLTFRVLCRLVKQVVRREDVAFRALTWACLKRRILQHKAERVESWRRSLERLGLKQ